MPDPGARRTRGYPGAPPSAQGLIGTFNESQVRHLRSQARRVGRLSLGLTALVVAFTAYTVAFHRERVLHNLQVLPPEIRLAGLVAALVLPGLMLAIVLTLTFMRQGYLSVREHRVGEHAFVWQTRLFAAVLNAGLMTLAVLALLYVTGVVRWLFDLFQAYLLPQLTALANMILANLIGWILSGIVGGVSYDLLKRWVARQPRGPRRR